MVSPDNFQGESELFVANEGIRGYRYWLTGTNDIESHFLRLDTLYSPIKNSRGRNMDLPDIGWHPGMQKAECLCLDKSFLRAHRLSYHSFLQNHTCGFYAFSSFEYAVELSRSEGTRNMWGTPVIGVMEGWGKVKVGTQGFTSEEARIIAIYTGPSIGERLFAGLPFAIHLGFLPMWVEGLDVTRSIAIGVVTVLASVPYVGSLIVRKERMRRLKKKYKDTKFISSAFLLKRKYPFNKDSFLSSTTEEDGLESDIL